jgi:hypothetical protein
MGEVCNNNGNIVLNSNGRRIVIAATPQKGAESHTNNPLACAAFALITSLVRAPKNCEKIADSERFVTAIVAFLSSRAHTIATIAARVLYTLFSVTEPQTRALVVSYGCVPSALERLLGDSGARTLREVAADMIVVLCEDKLASERIGMFDGVVVLLEDMCGDKEREDSEMYKGINAMLVCMSVCICVHVCD